MSRIARIAVKSSIVAAVAAAATLLSTPAAAGDAMTFRPGPRIDTSAVVAVPAQRPEEDEPGFACAVDGNHVCGPNNSEGVPAGCYDDGTLVVPWSRYDEPQADPLYGQLTSPCMGQAPTQEQESDAAYAAAQGDSEDDGYLPVADTTRPAAGSCSEPLPSRPTPAPAPQPAPQTRPLVNVNTATVAQLDALPGIGDVLAARIVAQRPYSSVNDLHRVARIPAKVFPLVTV